MKKFTYPATLYYSDGMYALILKDIDLVSAGESAERAFEDMLDMLDIYLGIAHRYSEDIPKATEYTAMEKEVSKAGKVMLVGIKVKASKEEKWEF